MRYLFQHRVNKPEQYRRVATRYEKIDLSMVTLGPILLWIEFVNTA